MSTSSPPIAHDPRASTDINDDIKGPRRLEHLSKKRRILHVAQAASTQDVLLFLIAFRILNALCIKTFFQPDEYFQSLEPAWRMVFGEESGAWITWVYSLLPSLIVNMVS
jgi:hypothetical protein